MARECVIVLLSGFMGLHGGDLRTLHGVAFEAKRAIKSGIVAGGDGGDTCRKKSYNNEKESRCEKLYGHKRTEHGCGVWAWGGWAR